LILRRINGLTAMIVFVCHLMERNTMMDLVFVALIVGFFAASVGLVRFCAGLLSQGGKP
jgi:succinate-acetate transporter protein